MPRSFYVAFVACLILLPVTARAASLTNLVVVSQELAVSIDAIPGFASADLVEPAALGDASLEIDQDDFTGAPPLEVLARSSLSGAAGPESLTISALARIEASLGSDGAPLLGAVSSASTSIVLEFSVDALVQATLVGAVALDWLAGPGETAQAFAEVTVSEDGQSFLSRRVSAASGIVEFEWARGLRPGSLYSVDVRAFAVGSASFPVEGAPPARTALNASAQLGLLLPEPEPGLALAFALLALVVRDRCVSRPSPFAFATRETKRLGSG